MRNPDRQTSKRTDVRARTATEKDSKRNPQRRKASPIEERKAGSKTEQVLALLSRAGGASIVDLTSATDWLPHTTRAALTGLRKRGHIIEAERKEGGPTVYRLIAPTAAKPKRRPATAKAKA